jgi:uncharacterized protein (TIGR02611 family)
MSESQAPSSKKAAARKALRTIVGGIVLLTGIVTIPYPGPGWLIVFTGLAILAQDYPAAQRVLDVAKGKYDAWQLWLRRQPVHIRVLFWLFTVVVVVATIYLLNGYGVINQLLNLNQDWLISPFFK